MAQKKVMQMNFNNAVELLTLALMYALIALGLAAHVCCSIAAYFVKLWFREREDYVKRMSLEVPDNEFTNVH